MSERSSRGPVWGSASPPRLSRRLLALLLPPRIRAQQIGDLDEEFRLRLFEDGARRNETVAETHTPHATATAEARRWYRRQVLRSLAPAIACRLRDLELRNRLGKLGTRTTVDVLAQDLRFGLRTLRRSPGFTVVAIVTLALGIGANTAIFSVVNAVLLRPLSAADADRLAAVWEESAARDLMRGTVAPANFYDWRAQVDAFHDAAAYGTGAATLGGDGLPESVATAWVTGNFFEVLGVGTAHGRTLREEETWSDAPPVVVVSDRLWTRRFGRDPAIVGSTVTLDEMPHEVVGIMPAGLDLPDRDVDIWRPLGWRRSDPNLRWFREERFLHVVARLQEGATLEQARAQLQSVAERLQRDHPETNRDMGADLASLQESLVGDARRPLLVLLGATALLLLLTCTNLANLLLVRASGRRREVALRAALGAGRGRVVRQMLTESLVVALLGGMAGVGAGMIGSRMLIGMQPPGAWRAHAAPLDVPVLVFAIVVTLASAVLFGVAPALRATAGGAATGLRIGARASSGPRSRRMSQTLVAAEIALALVLLTGAGLLLRSFIALRNVDPGFGVEDRAAASVVLPARYQEDAQVLAFVDEMTGRLDGIPGVRAVTYASRLPLHGTNLHPGTLTIEGRGPVEPGADVGGRIVAPSYFQVMGVPLLAGRSFESADRAGSEPVIIINQQTARQLFPNEDPLGRRVTWDRDPGPEAHWYRIVGVVGNEHQNGLRAPAQMETFLSFRQLPGWRVQFFLRTLGAPAESLAALVRSELAAVDPLVPLSAFTSLAEMYASALGPDRFLLTLMSAFGALALMLAIVGVYGVLTEATNRRTRELGIRMALGATPVDVARVTLARSVAPIAAGIALGLLGALAAARLMASLLFEVAAHDAITFLVAPCALAVTAAIACAIPTVRAMRLDPLGALRDE